MWLKRTDIWTVLHDFSRKIVEQFTSTWMNCLLSFVLAAITYTNTNLYGSEFVIITVEGSQLTEILRTKLCYQGCSTLLNGNHIHSMRIFFYDFYFLIHHQFSSLKLATCIVYCLAQQYLIKLFINIHKPHKKSKWTYLYNAWSI